MDNIYKIIQSNFESKGQVRAYCDSFILMDDYGTVKYLSFFGTTAAVKSITAQIIGNRNGVLIRNEKGYVTDDNTGYPLHLKRGYDVNFKTLTKNLRPGVTHKLIYDENLFMPWKFPDYGRFLALGRTESEAVDRAFTIVDKISNIPLKESWKQWLWKKLNEYYEGLPVKTGGNVPEFNFCKVLFIPEDEWIENEIREDLSLLKAA